MQTLTEKAVALIEYLDRNAKPEQKQTATPTIDALLSQSRAQHQIYRRSVRHRANGVVIDGNATAAAEAVSASARLRAEAEMRDPQHTDPAWADDLAAKFPHAAMVEFYAEEVKYYVPPVLEAKSVDVTPKPVEDATLEATPDAEAR